MESYKKINYAKRAFTIVELLTVMAVIAILIGLLVPALHLVDDHAKELQQKAQFHSIEVALELFKTDFDYYPPSNENPASETSPLSADPANYGGAQKLAEALVGYDLLGFHPKSGFRSDGYNYFKNSTFEGYALVYAPSTGIIAGDDTELRGGAENIQNREGPFIDLENANAYRISDVYGINNENLGEEGFDLENADNYVLCDIYSKRRPSGEKTGMPVLYYRARTSYIEQDYRLSNGGIANDIYFYPDNAGIIGLGTAETQPLTHTIEGTTVQQTYENFEKKILNEQLLDSASLKRPYRAGSYILFSAGKDGLYGTSDDILNFKKEE